VKKLEVFLQHSLDVIASRIRRDGFKRQAIFARLIGGALEKAAGN